MIFVLINVLIIVVVGALLFYLIDRFVRDGPTGKPAQNSCGADFSCGDPATIAAGARRIIVLASLAHKKIAPTVGRS
jgi:hypothetical protein